jgi:1-acyl-sn-glycerol-3-phosphate acyltransferase
MLILQAIRTFLFYLLLGTSSLLWCSLSFFIAPFLPFKARYRFINVYWCRCALWLSKVFLGIRYEVKGAENYVPFFGWAMAMLRPIAIDRDNPKAALKHVAQKGDELLKDNVWVLIFPEGTRVPYGTIGKFSRGGSALAVNAELPVLPIAHNAGKFWPKTGWAKKQGVITVIIGTPMYAEGTGPRAIAELNDRVQAWNEQMQREMGSLPPAPQAPVSNDQMAV